MNNMRNAPLARLARFRTLVGMSFLILAVAPAAGKTVKPVQRPPTGTVSCRASDAAALPAPREEAWLAAHKKREARLQQGNVDVLLIGDSITAGWSRQPELVKKFFGSRQVVNLGHPADKTENILWRLRNHSFDRVKPGVAVVLAGTNNSNGDDYTPEQIAGGVQAIVAELRERLPQTKILLLGIFPRGSIEQRQGIKKGRMVASMNPQWEKIDKVNRMLSAFADGQWVVYLNINCAFLNEKGELPVEVFPDLLHPNAKGYEAWGRALQPALETIFRRERDTADGSASGKNPVGAFSGDTIRFFTDQTALPRVNDHPVNLEPTRVYDSPFRPFMYLLKINKITLV